jgi:F0F1-type ATP synthase membrane subunit b/b'
MKTNLSIATGIAAVAFGLWGCSQSNPQEARDTMNNKLEKIEDKMQDAKVEAETPKEWVSERNDILDDLRSLRDNIDDQLAKHNVKLADKDLKKSERREHEAMKAEFEKEKGIVEGLVKNVEGATDATWATVKVDTRKTSDEVKAWWAKMKEDMDRKTDADKDNDGH